MSLLYWTNYRLDASQWTVMIPHYNSDHADLCTELVCIKWMLRAGWRRGPCLDSCWRAVDKHAQTSNIQCPDKWQAANTACLKAILVNLFQSLKTFKLFIATGNCKHVICDLLPQKQGTSDILYKMTFLIVRSTLSALVWYQNQIHT